MSYSVSCAYGEFIVLWRFVSMDRGVHHEEVVQVGGGECCRLGMTGGVVCSYCLPASKTKPKARREGEESILVADNGTFSVSQMSRDQACLGYAMARKRTFKNIWEMFEWRTGKGYLECEQSSGIEVMGRRLNLQINVRTGIMEHCDVNT